MLVTVTPSGRVASLEVEGFGRSTAFWPAGGAGSRQALVGIPIDTPPGARHLEVRATGADGLRAVSRVELEVKPGQFTTRELRVDNRFVNPPASAAARIRREAQTLARLFAQVRPGRLWQGPFAAPVPGRSSSSFGRLSVFNGEPRGRHQGADFEAATGTPVVAPNAGEVLLAKNLYFAGNSVLLDHGEGLYSFFAHLSRIAVKVGARVERGDRLGAAGATGRVTGPHLHWAVRLRGTSVDPLSLMAAAERGENPERQGGRGHGDKVEP